VNAAAFLQLLDTFLDSPVCKDWDESLHPRDDGGRFASGSGSSAADTRTPVPYDQSRMVLNTMSQRFDLTQSVTGYRRFLFNPDTHQLILGEHGDSISTMWYGTHGQDLYAVTGTSAGYDDWVKGELLDGSQLTNPSETPGKVVSFLLPPVRDEYNDPGRVERYNESHMLYRAIQTLEMFAQNGGRPDTLLMGLPGLPVGNLQAWGQSTYKYLFAEVRKDWDES